MGGARFGDPSPPHQLRWRAASASEATGTVAVEKVDRISLMGSRGRAPSVAPALAPCPVLDSIALGADLTARPPLFCLHHFVDHRPKILTGFVP